MLMSLTLRRNRLIALVAAVAMIVVMCGYIAHDPVSSAGHSCHCDWTTHFLGVAGSAPHPVPVVKPLLARWLVLPIGATTPRSIRRLRAHLARAPPPALSIG
jgi:hypothetical protein